MIRKCCLISVFSPLIRMAEHHTQATFLKISLAASSRYQVCRQRIPRSNQRGRVQIVRAGKSPHPTRPCLQGRSKNFISTLSSQIWCSLLSPSQQSNQQLQTQGGRFPKPKSRSLEMWPGRTYRRTRKPMRYITSTS